MTQNGQDVNGHNTGQPHTPTAPLPLGSYVDYSINSKWHTKGVDTDNDHYSQFSIKDPLNKNLLYQTDSAKVVDQSTGTDITNQGNLIFDKSTSTLTWSASSKFMENTPLDGRVLVLSFRVKTPLIKTYGMKNQGGVSIDTSEGKTNTTIIGVDSNFPVLIIPRTGSYHIGNVLALCLFFLFCGLGILYKRMKQ